jgi:chorismate mutase/prephenate dehydratase
MNGAKMSSILYLGPAGTHSHEAAVRWCNNPQNLQPCRSLNDVFVELLRQPQSVAIVPVENSIEGPVTQTLDLLANTDGVQALASFSINIRHNLLVNEKIKDLKEIRKVFSHPQALAQSSAWLQRNLPEADIMASASTAEAARLAAASTDTAAVAGMMAAELYGLKTLATDVQESSDNQTRFLAVSTAPQQIDTANRTSLRTLLYIVLHDKPGALLQGLEPFHAAGLNLTSIQSRPLRGRPWEYGFFMEINGDITAPAHAGTFERIRALAEICRLLGVYPIVEPAEKNCDYILTSAVCFCK